MKRSAIIVAAFFILIITVVGLIHRHQFAAGMSGITDTEAQASESSYRVVTLDLSRVKLRTQWKRADGTLLRNFQAVETEARTSGQKLLFATNAGIFTPERVPLGLYIEDGRERVPINRADGQGNFFLKPNGVFWLNGSHAAITETSLYAPPISPDVAVQSGPMLIVDGKINSSFSANSVNRTIRSGVGIVTDSKVVFAISRSPVTFREFAAFFRDNLQCRNALYLDGTISQIYVRGQSDSLDTGDFAAMFIATR